MGNKFLMWIKAVKGRGEEEGRAVVKSNLRRVIKELRRIERAEKIQERVIAKRRVLAEKAIKKGYHEIAEKAKSEEEEALTVLERIKEDKRRVEEELRNALAELRGEKSSEESDSSSSIAPVSDTEAVTEQEVVKGEGEEASYLERYPVNPPYAYIVIENTSPPIYRVSEVSLTVGEEELLKEIKNILYETMDVSFTSVTNPEEFLTKTIKGIIKDFNIELGPERMDKIMYYGKRDLIGYGKLDPIIRDKMAEDISADGPEIPLYVYHRNYGSIRTNVVFDKEELDSLIYKLSQRAGRHISLARPLLDASLPTKDRLQLSIGSEITTRGSTFTIRKFREIPLSPIDLINLGTFSVEMIAYLWMAVENGFNTLISGGTASGKTTVLNAIAMFIPPESKIVSIEDTKEINLMHENWIPSITKEVEEGGRSIEMFDLLKAALRQRPEYILVGEVRGREAYTLFQAMATGHITFSTIHADSAEAVVKRLTKPPIDVPLMLLDSLNIIPLQRMVKIGPRRARRCVKMIEVTGVDFENEMLRTNELFTWRPDEFQFSAESGVFNEIMDKLNMNEDELSEEFSRRVKVLEWMNRESINEFDKISQIIFEYNIDPERVMKKMGSNEK